jgi:hypothetical protein
MTKKTKQPVVEVDPILGQLADHPDDKRPAKGVVYVGVVGTPDDDEFSYPPGTIVTAAIPW